MLLMQLDHFFYLLGDYLVLHLDKLVYIFEVFLEINSFHFEEYFVFVELFDHMKRYNFEVH